MGCLSLMRLCSGSVEAIITFPLLGATEGDASRIVTQLASPLFSHIFSPSCLAAQAVRAGLSRPGLRMLPGDVLQRVVGLRSAGAGENRDRAVQANEIGVGKDVSLAVSGDHFFEDLLTAAAGLKGLRREIPQRQDGKLAERPQI